MRNDRYMQLVMNLLEIADHPDIAGWEFYSEEGVWFPKAGIEVKMKDGTSIRLRCVGTYPKGGDDHSQPEKIPFPEYQIPVEEVRNVPSLRSVRRG